MAGSYFQILSAINLLEPYYGHPLLLLEYESAFNVLWQGLMKYCNSTGSFGIFLYHVITSFSSVDHYISPAVWHISHWEPCGVDLLGVLILIVRLG